MSSVRWDEEVIFNTCKVMVSSPEFPEKRRDIGQLKGFVEW